MNIHTPNRIPEESLADYKERRAASKAAVRTMTKGPRQAPAVSPLDVSRFFLGQHTNPEKNQRRQLLKSLGVRKLKSMTKLACRAAVGQS